MVKAARFVTTENINKIGRPFHMASIEVLIDMAKASDIDVSDIEYDPDRLYSFKELEDIDSKLFKRVFPTLRDDIEKAMMSS